jgi:hypothetical protein
MSRKRAGHASTAIIDQKGRMIWLIQRVDGVWITTGEARGWPRCRRCRRPHQQSPFDSELCSTCYFYKALPVDEFWRLHNAGYYLAPYNIGKRCMQNTNVLRTLYGRRDWRARLREQLSIHG